MSPALERLALLNRQKHAAERSHHYWYLARLRIMQGYFGAAKFYQHQSARWHQRAVELRSEINPPQPCAAAIKLAMSSAYGRFKIAPYTGPIGEPISIITGSKPMPDPESFARFLA